MPSPRPPRRGVRPLAVASTRLATLAAAGLLAAACGGTAAPEEVAPGGGAEPTLGVGGDGAFGDDGAETVGGRQCQVLDVPARRVAPDLLVLVDRSGSMAGERWSVAAAAVAETVENLAAAARFGLTFFPARGQELACTGGTVVVEPGPGSAPAVASALRDPGAAAKADFGYTPTRATLEETARWVARSPSDGRPRYVLLVTDGRPNCPRAGAQHEGDEAPTLAALDALRAAGVRTFVVGYRTGDLAATMDAMAQRGGTERHHPVTSAADLVAALGSITQTAATCTFQLGAPARSEALVRVTVDGERVPLDSAQGWALETPTTLSLRGRACERVRSAGATVKVVVECEAEAPK